MSDTEWDKSKFPNVARADKWEGEDEEDDIKDNWDDEEEEAEKIAKENAVQPVVAKPQKNVKKKQLTKIKEKEIQEEERELTEEEKQRLQEESDLMLAKEAFGDDNDSKNGASLSDISLSTKDDFDAFKRALVTKLVAVEKSAHYVAFLETLFRELCASLEADDIKRISGSLSALFNEKIKAQKAGTKPKKKGKGFSLKVERNEVDFDTGNDGGDYDDFM